MPLLTALNLTNDDLLLFLGEVSVALRLVVGGIGPPVEESAVLDGVRGDQAVLVAGVIGVQRVLCKVQMVFALATLQKLHVGVYVHAVGALDVHEKFLGVAPDLGARPRLDVQLDFLPVFAVDVEC